MKYQKKPVVIEAFPLTPEHIPDILDWSTQRRPIVITTAWDGGDGQSVVGADITTLEGTMHADPGDYIIKGVAGEIYPCKPNIFRQSYEPVETDEEIIAGWPVG